MRPLLIVSIVLGSITSIYSQTSTVDSIRVLQDGVFIHQHDTLERDGIVDVLRAKNDRMINKHLKRYTKKMTGANHLGKASGAVLASLVEPVDELDQTVPPEQAGTGVALAALSIRKAKKANKHLLKAIKKYNSR